MYRVRSPHVDAWEWRHHTKMPSWVGERAKLAHDLNSLEVTMNDGMVVRLRLGAWLVKWPGGHIEALAPAAFMSRFEPVED